MPPAHSDRSSVPATWVCALGRRHEARRLAVAAGSEGRLSRGGGRAGERRGGVRTRCTSAPREPGERSDASADAPPAGSGPSAGAAWTRRNERTESGAEDSTVSRAVFCYGIARACRFACLYGRSAQGDQNSDQSGEDEATDHPSTDREQPDKSPGEHRDLPRFVESEAERDRGAADGADHRGACPDEEGLNSGIGPDLIESRAPCDDEDEGRGEGDEDGDQRATDARGGIAHHSDRQNH